MTKWLIAYYFGDFVRATGISVILPSGKRVVEDIPKSAPSMRFTHWRDLARIIWRPNTAFIEAFAEERILLENASIYEILERLLNPDALEALPRAGLWVEWCFSLFHPLVAGWSLKRAKHNVHRHYDLGNQFYSLFLDEDWQYSCAYFDDPNITLDEAQRRKKEHILRKLVLNPDSSVLDIGCGWGGMAIHLAPLVKSVKGITLSEEQLAKAQERIKGKNLNIEFALTDYREENGVFDRVVSVGMLEHVGKAHYDTFFSTVDRCLNKDGVALIHTIGRPDVAKSTNPFIHKYIFPGGYLPSLSQLSKAIEKTDLMIADIEVLFLHYAETLRHWRMRFLENKDKVVALYDEKFARIWECYLASCEVNFRFGNLMVFQIQLIKPKSQFPTDRRYIYS